MPSIPSVPVTSASQRLIASCVARIDGTGSGSNGSASVLTGPPLRIAGQPANDCATIRRAPAASAPASRCSVPSVRSRFVAANARSMLRGSLRSPSAVSWWTTTSGSAAVTAATTASRSSASATTASAPAARSAPAFAPDLVMPVTSWPSAISARTSGVPMAPVAPAMKMRMGRSPLL